MEVTQAISPEELAALKARQGKDIYELKIALDEAGTYVYGYLTKPSRQVLSLVMSKIQSDPIGSIEIMLRNCMLTDVSDSRILEDDELFMAATQSVGDLITIKQAELKKT